ncbi:hypothetical protein QMT25_10890 [Cronobacter dublinensis]|uniref:hypothetical protein n=1 Tax=Cronobacter dublinensis TaxID=413497 RepID=UPI0024C2DAAF|nr:hypothetical protein [Cronobacter dublinensis]EKY3086954.1 hypothetical protein [Cronobacter dublinensis]MDK1197461.1 hypothetical protein [Cronobacter dublinensis]
MDKSKKLEFYEKLYYQAGDVQEKLHARVQGVFAFALIISSAIHYVIKNLIADHCLWLTIPIVIFMFSSSLLLIFSISKLTKAFWGNKYAIITTPQDLDNYHAELEATKTQQEAYNISYPNNKVEVINPDQMMSDFYYEKMREVATTNMNINNNRQENIHLSVKFMLWSLAPFAAGLALFLIANLDSSAPRNNHSSETRYVIVNNPINI